MLTRICALALIAAYASGLANVCAQEGERIIPLPPIQSEFSQQPALPVELPDPANQDVGWVSSSWLPIDESWKDFLLETRVYWDSDLIVFNTTVGPTSGEDTFAASRNELGWEHRSGYGVRAQYLTLEPGWNVTHGPMGTEIINPAPGDVYNYAPYYAGSLLLRREVDNLNFDLYKRIELGKSEVMFGVGMTTVRNIEELQQIFQPGGPGNSYSYIHADQSIKGVGVGLSGGLRHPVFAHDTWEVAFLLNGRTSYVPVDVESQSQLAVFQSEHNMKLHEGKIGIEVLKRFETVTGVARVHYENQQWDNDTTDIRSFDGVSFSVGLAW
jgi:hypothetical protein